MPHVLEQEQGQFIFAVFQLHRRAIDFKRA